MAKKGTGRKLGTYVNVALGLVFLVASMITVALVNFSMRQQAIAEAESKARILLDRNLATHTYFTHNLKPNLFNLTAPITPKEYFEPSWMSSTYALREIDKYFKKLNATGYYYKDAAINARSPENEADEEEKTFLFKLNKNKKIEQQSGLRTIKGQPYYVVMKRGEILETSCLRCHSTPPNAPGDLVRIYGAERSFNRQAGEVISVISIRIPLAEAYSQANLFSLRLSLILLAVLCLLFAAQFFIYKYLLLKPLSKIKERAQQIASNEELLGEEIVLPSGKELQELTRAFNEMSLALRHNLDNLEDRVNQRTAELTTLNEKLLDEISERQRIAEENEKLISVLREALSKVKTLSGLLPVCSSCKKIRDDKGYWEQMEVYIRDHSEADFSHSLCPDCAKKIYDEIYKPK